jgi:hypothetical protein
VHGCGAEIPRIAAERLGSKRDVIRPRRHR